MIHVPSFLEKLPKIYLNNYGTKNGMPKKLQITLGKAATTVQIRKPFFLGPFFRGNNISSKLFQKTFDALFDSLDFFQKKLERVFGFNSRERCYFSRNPAIFTKKYH